jgi:hypothetical protein
LADRDRFGENVRQIAFVASGVCHLESDEVVGFCIKNSSLFVSAAGDSILSPEVLKICDQLFSKIKAYGNWFGTELNP